jgi:translation initiation factor IF-3
VEVAPTARPPVCKIMDYGRYKYELEKKEKEAKKKQKIIHLKEIQMRPVIEEHDYQFKMHHLRKFLEKGDRTKVVIIFKGRELTHLELGQKVIARLKEDLKDLAEMEKPPKMETRNMIAIFIPKPKETGKSS